MFRINLQFSSVNPSLVGKIGYRCSANEAKGRVPRLNFVFPGSWIQNGVIEIEVLVSRWLVGEPVFLFVLTKVHSPS